MSPKDSFGGRTPRRTALHIGVAIGAIGAALALTPAVAALTLGAGWLDIAAPGPPEPHFDAIVVLNGDIGFHRTRHATSLLIAGVAPALMATGAGFGGDDARAMALEARLAGAPADAVIIEHTATTTVENVRAVHALAAAEGWRTVLVVTSPTHTRRVRLLADRLLPELAVSLVSAPGGREPTFRSLTAEYAKLLIHWLLVW